MSDRHTSFIKQAPTEDLATVLALVRGQNPPKADLGLAWNNAESYIMGLYLGDPTPSPVFGAAPMTNAKAEEMLVQLSPDASGTMSAAPKIGGGALLLLLQFLGPKVLEYLLKLLNP